MRMRCPRTRISAPQHRLRTQYYESNDPAPQGRLTFADTHVNRVEAPGCGPVKVTSQNVRALAPEERYSTGSMSRRQVIVLFRK